MVRNFVSFDVFGLVDHYIFHCKVGFTTTSFVVSFVSYSDWSLFLSLTSGHDTTDDLAVTRI